MYLMAKPCLYMYDAKLTLSLEVVYRFIVFNHTESKIPFRENWLIFCGMWGKAELILGVCHSEARQNTLR